MRGRISLKQWARLYGVSHSNRKDGFMRYTATVTARDGQRLIVPELRLPFGPSLKEALCEHVEDAQVAEAFHGDFGAYRARQGSTRPLTEQASRFAPHLKAWRDLYVVFGKEAARALLLRVKEYQ